MSPKPPSMLVGLVLASVSPQFFSVDQRQGF